MDDIEETLTDWGREWRAQQPDARLPDLRAAIADHSRRSFRPWVLAPVLLLGLGGFLIWTSRLGMRPGAEIQSVSFRPGDSVVAFGDIVEQADGRTLVCHSLTDRGPRPAGGEPVPICSAVAVPIVDLDFADVPGLLGADGSRFVYQVKVLGIWDAAGLRVEKVVAAVEPTPILENPCVQAEGDGTGLGTVEEEDALRRLGELISSSPHLYGGLWRAQSADGLGRLVVGVAGDTDSVRAELISVYPFPMCLVRVDHSVADLEATLAELQTRDAEWRATLDIPRNRVRVSLGVLTPATADLLKPYSASIVIEELVRRP